jgi:DNA-binding PadR family transcriptional regulator
MIVTVYVVAANRDSLEALQKAYPQAKLVEGVLEIEVDATSFGGARGLAERLVSEIKANYRTRWCKLDRPPRPSKPPVKKTPAPKPPPKKAAPIEKFVYTPLDLARRDGVDPERKSCSQRDVLEILWDNPEADITVPDLAHALNVVRSRVNTVVLELAMRRLIEERGTKRTSARGPESKIYYLTAEGQKRVEALQRRGELANPWGAHDPHRASLVSTLLATTTPLGVLALVRAAKTVLGDTYDIMHRWLEAGLVTEIGTGRQKGYVITDLGRTYAEGYLITPVVIQISVYTANPEDLPRLLQIIEALKEHPEFELRHITGN